MTDTDGRLRTALERIAAGRSDLVGATSLATAWYAAVGLAREALGRCRVCGQPVEVEAFSRGSDRGRCPDCAAG